MSDLKTAIEQAFAEVPAGTALSAREVRERAQKYYSSNLGLGGTTVHLHHLYETVEEEPRKYLPKLQLKFTRAEAKVLGSALAEYRRELLDTAAIPHCPPAVAQFNSKRAEAILDIEERLIKVVLEG